MVSLPASPLKMSSPRPPSRLSLPSPPSRVSLPAPPSKVSSPAAPTRLSLPLVPLNRSFPLEPTWLRRPSSGFAKVPSRLRFTVKLAPLPSTPVRLTCSTAESKSTPNIGPLLGGAALRSVTVHLPVAVLAENPTRFTPLRLSVQPVLAVPTRASPSTRVVPKS